MTATVFVFAKPPRMGLSKTRLARSLNRTEARRIARFTLERSLKAASDPRWTAVISTAPAKSVWAEFTPSGRHLPRIPQGPGDLGDRLARAYEAAPRGPVIFIGGDTPNISARLIWRAIKATKPGQVAVGPSRDGGFWLLGLWKGLKANHPFSEVRWSHPQTLEDIMANVPVRVSVHRLPSLIDIDDADDWATWTAASAFP
ncbi:MAG: DUF2064 domain-containing protein [Pseudomonadota bacterium]